MSRIGKKTISLPKGVTVAINDGTVLMKGPKGELSLTLHSHAHVSLREQDGLEFLDVTVREPEREDRAIWGTMRALLAQMVIGVSEGYSKSLELNGVGFKMNIQGANLVLSLGFSHDITLALPAGIAAKIEQNVLTIHGTDAALVGRIAAEIRAMKKPEPYKGKGFRYTNEIIRRKAGKASKSE